MHYLTSFLCFVFVTLPITLGDEARIYNAQEFVELSNNVNNGINYYGTTVYLESDIDFTEELSAQFEPIGMNPFNYFQGTFDGQGYTINNLAIKSSSAHVGLFGFSGALIIQNVVMDSSCSVICNFTGEYSLRIGGIIGLANINSTSSLISNIVNMANVTFEGNANGSSGYLHLGGIFGYILSLNHDANIKNCMNYGYVTSSGEASGDVIIGGIVGETYASLSNVTLQNCLNYGVISCGTAISGRLYVGGIVGSSEVINLVNCVSAGKINFNTKYKGGIIGNAESNVLITHCLWTSDVYCDVECGARATSSFSSTNSSLITVNSTVVDDLNEYANNGNNYNKWFFNESISSILFKPHINKKGFTLSSQLILIPGFANGWRTFMGWYTDDTIETPFDSTLSVIDGTSLYGKWSKYIVTFDLNGGDNISYSSGIVNNEDTYGSFPVATKVGYAFIGWFTKNNETVASDSKVTCDHTLYARWVPNNYTVFFNASNSISEKVVTFNDIYDELPLPSKENYVFVGWFNEDNEIVTRETLVKTPCNHTLYAQWEEMPTNHVDIIFGTKDLTRDKVEEIIKRYTDDNFEIVKFEDDPDGTKVIVKFTDSENAKDFVMNVKESSGALKSIIKRIEYDYINFINDSILVMPFNKLYFYII